MRKHIGIAVMATLIGGCGTGLGSTGLGSIGGVDVDSAAHAVGTMGKALTLSDQEVQAAAREMRAYEEQNVETPAGPDDAHSQRLNKLVSRYSSYDGLPLNYKVYANPAVNANATADGSVRVYTGLMDLMNDEEMLCVIGHEIGHVKNGHSAKEMRTQLALRGVREGAAASGSMLGSLAAGQMGGLLEAVINAQYSQTQETQSDDYGLKFSQAAGLDGKGCVSALEKLAQLGGGQHSILSSHPEPHARAQRMANMVKSN